MLSGNVKYQVVLRGTTRVQPPKCGCQRSLSHSDAAPTPRTKEIAHCAFCAQAFPTAATNRLASPQKARIAFVCQKKVNLGIYLEKANLRRFG